MRYAAEYMGSPADPADGMLRLGMSSTAGLLLHRYRIGWVGSDRTNRPGTGRKLALAAAARATPELAKKMHRLAALYGRI